MENTLLIGDHLVVDRISLWAEAFPDQVKDGDLVVPAGQFFMMGDHRHGSLDSRVWRRISLPIRAGRAR